ncbi:MAG: hypothetical protein AB7F99_14900 [Vicinamibacterales bacterium]
MWKMILFPLIAAVSLAGEAHAGPFAPLVDMEITLPGGRIEQLSAPESGLAHVMLDGVEYAFRPTIMDSQPWNRVIVTIFRRVSPTAATEVLGEVELKTRRTPVAAPTEPGFRVAVTNVSLPPATSSGRS